MDETLETMLRALEGLDAPSVADRVSALDALAEELPQLSQLSSDDWDVKLAKIEDDVEELGDAADRSVGRFEQARRALETLKRFAAQRGVELKDPSDAQIGLFTDGGNSDASEGRGKNPIAQAESTREAILQAMARRPHRDWSPTAVADDLVRYGRVVERSNVQVTMRRLASEGRIRKVGRGTYQILVATSKDPQDDVALTEAERKKAVRHRAAVKAAETKRRKREAGEA